METMNPYTLLSPARFDIMAKQIYARCFLKKQAMDWATYVYSNHLRAWGFSEDTWSEEIICFQKLLEAINYESIVQESNLVSDFHALTSDRMINLPAFLFYHKNIGTSYQAGAEKIFDFRYFLQNGISQQIADAMALEYCQIHQGSLVVVQFPIAQGKDHQIRNILSEVGEIFYEKKISLTSIGRYNILRQLYKDEWWIGEEGEISSGLLHHLSKRFIGKEPVKFIFITSSDLRKVKEAKKSIRALVNLGDDSVHISDTYEKTLDTAEYLLTPNSAFFINSATPCRSKNFQTLLQELKEQIRKDHIDKENICLGPDAVLAAFGLRDVGDIDYLFDGKFECSNKHLKQQNMSFYNHGILIKDLIHDPRNFFYYEDLKFLSLENARKIKEAGSMPQNRKDIALINSLLRQNSFEAIRRESEIALKIALKNHHHQAREKIRSIAPDFLKSLIRKSFMVPFYLKEAVGPKERSRLYQGYQLYYSRGSAQIEHIIKGKIFQPELSSKIINFLQQTGQQTFLDIGAELGLVCLNISTAIPNLRVYAFEPDMELYRLFQKTIAGNQLVNRVFLFNEPLCMEEPQKKPMTLSNWWLACGKPEINVVRINVKGKALSLLRGSEQFIKECRPVIFLETKPDHLQEYPYTMEDILSFFSQHNYRLETLSWKQVQNNNITELCRKTDIYIAFPCV